MKKLTASVVAVILSMLLMLTTVCAAPSVSVVTSAQPASGEIFTVNVAINENPGVMYIQCKVSFANDVLTLINCTDSGLFDDFQQYIDPTDPGSLILTFTNNSIDNYSTGNIATITFIAGENLEMGALISVEVPYAFKTDGTNVTFDGMTTAVIFNTGDASGDNADEDFIFVEEEETDEEIIEDEEEVIEDEDTEEIEEVTKATESTTKATTTTKKTESTTKKTESETTTTKATTPEVTTTPAVTTTLPTSETTSETTPAVSEPIISSDNSESEQAPSENEPSTPTGNDYDKRASSSTVVLAVSLLLTTVLIIAGIEVYKRFFSGNN